MEARQSDLPSARQTPLEPMTQVFPRHQWVPSGTPQTLLLSALLNPKRVRTVGDQEWVVLLRLRPYGEVDQSHGGLDANLQGERWEFRAEHSVEVLFAVHRLRCD